MKNFFLLAFLFCSYSLFPQDTLVKVNGDKELVKVAEVNPELIKYHKSDNPGGPLYSVGKNDIRLIKYAGGHVDTFNLSKVADARQIKNTLVYYGTKVFFNSKPVGMGEFRSIIDQHPDANARSKMQNSYRRMVGHRDIATVSLSLGLVLGCAAVVVTNPFVTGMVDYGILPTDEGIQVAIAGILSGAALRISGFAVSHAQRNKKKAKIREIVAIYNGDYDLINGK